MYVRKRDAGLFKNIAFGEHTALTAATFGAIPAVTPKARAVEGLQSRGDAIVQSV
jgi:hypothetical protein